jgi:superfamily II DNA helicase RecQ
MPKSCRYQWQRKHTHRDRSPTKIADVMLLHRLELWQWTTLIIRLLISLMQQQQQQQTGTAATTTAALRRKRAREVLSTEHDATRRPVVNERKRLDFNRENFHNALAHQTAARFQSQLNFE